MILLEGYVYHDKIVQVSTEHLRNHNPALSYSDFAEIWSLCQARPREGRTGAGSVYDLVCWVCYVLGGGR